MIQVHFQLSCLENGMAQVDLSFAVLDTLFCCYDVTSWFLTQLGDSGWKPSLTCWILIYDHLI